MSAYLTGQLLIAMPSLEDNRFDRAVILVCAHDEKGAMGLVLNHKMDNIQFPDLIEQLEIMPEDEQSVPDLTVMQGGPVEQARGFLLHGAGLEQDDTIRVSKDFLVSGSVEALKKLISTPPDQKLKFMLGYSGWGAGQLDSEMKSNAWLTLDPDPSLVYETSPEDMWQQALKRIGIDPSMLSSAAGRA